MGIEPGQIIDGKYRVIRLIGEGGMGTVYEGENLRIERRVAIKVLHAHVASMPEFSQRFEREARASARIGSPHVCDVLDLGDLPDGERFIVMEYLEGMSLEDRLEHTTMTPAELAPIAFDILEGLGTMHEAGVIHRDLKPANIFLAKVANRRGEAVKILDFGVAKIIPRVEDTGNMTSTGMVMGTPLYMSPEQARGARDVDSRADLYSASVVFYRALTGHLPYMAENLHELIYKIAVEEPRPIQDAAPELIDEAFAAIVMKGLSRDPAGRYPSARAFQEEIAAWGRAQGRASLAFAMTLSSAPPARLSAVSVAVHGKEPPSPVAAVTPAGGTLSNEAADELASSPPRPRGARSAERAESNRGVSGAEPLTMKPARISGKTPTAWSEPTPIGTSLAETSLLEEPPKSAKAPEPPAPPPATSRKRFVLFGAVAASAFVAIALVALRHAGGAADAGKGPASAALIESPPAIATSVGQATAAPLPSPPAETAETSPAAATTSAPVVVPAKATLRAPLATASASANVAPSAAPSSSAPPPATASSGRRKFRTDL